MILASDFRITESDIPVIVLYKHEFEDSFVIQSGYWHFIFQPVSFYSSFYIEYYIYMYMYISYSHLFLLKTKIIFETWNMTWMPSMEFICCKTISSQYFGYFKKLEKKTHFDIMIYSYMIVLRMQTVGGVCTLSLFLY